VVGETVDAAGDDLLAAYVAAVEVGACVGAAMTRAHYASGWDDTGTLCTLGAAASAGVLLHLDAAGWGNALGTAGTMAAGVKASCGMMAHPMHAGNAAANGVTAARLAARGLTGNPDVVDAVDGLAAAAGAGEADLVAVAEIDHDWAIRRIRHKLYASNGWTHATITAALALRDRVRAGDVEVIEVRISPRQVELCPTAAPGTPPAIVGRRSLEVTSALALLGEDLAVPATFSPDRLRAPELVELAGLATVVADPEVELFDSRVTVRTVTSEPLTVVGQHDTGAAGPSSVDESARLEAKFRALVEPVLGPNATTELQAAIVERAPVRRIGERLDPALP
jgi:2-methylcitrate dehydratase PrpD